jgi:hypothetical protein
MKYEIRAMSFGEILDTGFRLFRNHFLVLTGIAAVLYVPLAACTAVLGSGAEDSAMIAAAIVFLVTMVYSPIIQAAITYTLGEFYLGRKVTLEQALRTGGSLFAPLVGTSLLATLAILGGTLLLVIPGIYLALCYLLVGQVMVLERKFGTSALGRSRALMRGNFARGVGVYLVAGILSGVLSVGVHVVTSAVPLLSEVASCLAQAVSAGFASAVGVVLYFDIRSRKEAFDIEHLAALVESGAAARSAAAPSPAPAT